jgi:hypothetical protein
MRDVRELATALLEAVDALEALVPNLERPHPSRRKHVLAQRTVPRDFLLGMAAAVERSEELERLGTFDPAEARAALQFEQEMGPVIDRVAFLLASLTFTVEWRKSRVAAAALRTYAIAKGLARNPPGGEVASLLPQLRRDLGHGRPRRKKTAEPPREERLPAVPARATGTMRTAYARRTSRRCEARRGLRSRTTDRRRLRSINVKERLQVRRGVQLRRERWPLYFRRNKDKPRNNLRRHPSFMA